MTLSGCAAPPALDPTAAPGGLYRVDPAHGIVTASIGHLGLSAYSGRFAEIAGELRFDAEAPERSRLAITIPARTIDLPDDGLEATIRGGDWLDVQAHRDIRFVSRAIERTGLQTGRVTGDLTIRDATHPVTLDTTFNGVADDA